MGNWNLYPQWYREFVRGVKAKRDRLVDAESELKNKDFDYAKSMQRMIALYNDVLEVCERHKPKDS
jgi:hypothetical protein